ncbi:MAG: response regulator [Bacteroidales bacterium]|jgi:signal transduction histidine kinase/CheY-like chemotaxis protein|nr:response regulator [Bacteroidales bacterium]
MSKKQALVPSIICIICIFLVALHCHEMRNNRIENAKESATFCISGIFRQIRDITQKAQGLSIAVKPLLTMGQITENPESHPECIEYIEKIFHWYPVIRNVALIDQQGYVLNVSIDESGHFIKDRFKSRGSVNVLRPSEDLVMNDNSYSYVVPIFSDDLLVANISVTFDMLQFMTAINSSYVKENNFWITVYLSHEKICITFPLEDELILSDALAAVEEMERNDNVCMQGSIAGKNFHANVVSCGKKVPFSDHFVGVIASENISDIFFSIRLFFITAAILLILLTVACMLALQYSSYELRKEIKEKEIAIQMLQSVFQVSPVGLMLFKDDKPVTANEFSLKILSDFIKISDTGVFSANLPARFMETTTAGNEEQWSLFSFENFGNEIHLLRNRTDTVIHLEKYTIFVFVDVTAMEQSRRNAVRSEIAKSELLSRISRDFKRPFDRIRDAIVLLIQQYPEDTVLTHLTGSVNLIAESIANMKDFGDIEAGNVTLDELPFDLCDTVKEAVEEYRKEAIRKKLKLCVNPDPAITGKVVGDAVRFKQILNQLLNNAVKYTDKGEIRISLSTTQLENNEVMIKCSVEDTGKGISAKQLKNLFSVDTRAKEGESIGLGTIIAKQLVNIMKGDILVSSPSTISDSLSMPGTKAFFTVLCPADVDCPKKPDYSAIVDREQLGILIVTTDIHSVQYQVNWLQRKSLHPELFEYGAETGVLLANKLIIDRNRYQLIVIEISNSETAFKILSELYEKGITQRHIFVFIDAGEGKGHYLRAKSFQVDYYLNNRDNLYVLESILSEKFPHLIPAKTLQNAELKKDLKILVCENNLLSQTVANLVFNKLGYHADFAKNFDDMKKCLENTSYDIVFIDMKFPPTNAITIADTLRRSGCNFPIIAVTSTPTKENIRAISDAGMNDYIHKPLDLEAVKTTLYKWLV